MKDCWSCGHNRLIHDSWGCKDCGCAISIIYISSATPSENSDETTEVIKLGNELVTKDDRVQESHLKVLYKRMVAERGLEAEASS